VKDPIAPLRTFREELQRKVTAAQADLQAIDRAIAMLSEKHAPKLLALPPPSRPSAPTPKRGRPRKERHSAPASKGRQNWSPEREQKFRKLYLEDGLRGQALAHAIGCSLSSAYSKVTVFGLANGHDNAPAMGLPPGHRACVECNKAFKSADELEDRCVRCRR
jgi:hypothetical protein